MPYRIVLICLLALLCGCALPGKDRGRARAGTDSLSEVFRRVNPAVVEVAGVRGSAGTSEGSASRGFLGSGVVISGQGRVLTSDHVVNTADRIAVRFLDGRTVRAEIVASAAQADVALLQLKTVPADLTVATLGDSDAVEVGDRIFVIGAPYGIRHTMTVGYIGGRRQSRSPCPAMSPFEFLQTDAAINQGNSGGPMVDSQGRVIGIVSRMLSRSGGSEGLGFAVGVNTVKKLLLDEEGYWIGFDAALVSGDMARALNVPQEAGLLVQRVARSSPAEELGLRPGRIRVDIGDRELLIGGDVILQIQGTQIRSSTRNLCVLQDIVGGFTSESRIEMTVLRNGRELHLSAEP